MIRRGLDATVSIVNLVQGANFRRKNNLECFVAGTLVETQDGPRAIEQVREGDWVLAWDEDAGELCWSRVEQTFVTPRQPIWRLTLKLPDGSEESLDCTPGHPFWADGEGWVSACHLQPGQDVATLSGPARVASVAPTGRNRTVYNFEVEGTHCYFVGTGGELVHNGKCGGVQTHYIATDKNKAGGYTEKFKRVFNRGGMSLQDPANKMPVRGHQKLSPHSPKYHAHVLERVDRASKGLSKRNARTALEGELDSIRQDINKNPKMLRGDGL